ncbi:hypothetical protein AB205_0082500 [Aquarana catesbeiana]|uniref:MHC class I-like antigen recognition-like domain-containing protein n=1 Tax=Aquarana catesbeiana TaxID=8400 RepID=A0A2G9S339_AQUCT|nr:hypothetical protein AB205_0082500 [Aquarana catesbeiana]
MTLWGSLEVEDIQALAAYNDTRLVEFKQSWSKKSLNDTDWEVCNMLLKRYYKNFQNHARNLIEKVLIKGAVLFQCWVGCSSSIDDIEDFTYKVALDGEDLVSINAKEGMWVAGNSPYSQDAQRMMQRENGTRKSLIDVLKHQCHLIALSYLTAGKEAYSRKNEIHHTLIGLIVGITVAVIVCVVGLACFVKLYKKRRRYTSIIGLPMDRLSWRRDW